MENIEFKIWFSKLEICNKNKLKLLKDFNSIEKIWNANEDELIFCGYENNLILKLKNKLYRENLEKEAMILQKENVEIISVLEEKYPTRLKEISNSPVQIYVKGNYQKLYEDNVGIIGSRNASEYGKNISRQIANELSGEGINVVSGLAIGIDKFAHIRCFR